MAQAVADAPWRKAADAMRARMAELGLTQFELAARSGISLATIREMLRAQPRHRSVRLLGAVSEALGWPADRLSSILKGTTVDTAAMEHGGGDATNHVGAELRAIREELARITRRLDALEAATSEDGR
jgi:transcriptional regulator with XRE-family HTH domain